MKGRAVDKTGCLRYQLDRVIHFVPLRCCGRGDDSAAGPDAVGINNYLNQKRPIIDARDPRARRGQMGRVDGDQLCRAGHGCVCLPREAAEMTPAP